LIFLPKGKKKVLCAILPWDVFLMKLIDSKCSLFHILICSVHEKPFSKPRVVLRKKNPQKIGIEIEK
jgi:hypothetical protein